MWVLEMNQKDMEYATMKFEFPSLTSAANFIDEAASRSDEALYFHLHKKEGEK